MKMKKINDEVFYTEESIVRIAKKDLDYLRQLADKNKRKRIRICAHRNINDETHEMLIVHARNSYVRPHKHLEKSESFHVIDGLADVIIFNDEGKIVDIISLGDYASGNFFYYRINKPAYHSLRICSDFIIFHEVTKGPFSKKDTMFAPWSPSEENPHEVEKFLLKLKNVKN